MSIPAIASSADFYPEDAPEGFVEWTFLVPKSCAFGAGVYRLFFDRNLSPAEIKDLDFSEVLRSAPGGHSHEG